MVENFNNSKPGNKHLGWLAGISILLIIIGFVYFFADFGKKEQPAIPNPAFAAYVSGYTGGTISRNHPIFIRLAIAPDKAVQTGDPLQDGLLTFRPEIKGNAFWKDSRTIEFLPSENMKSGKIYTAYLQLSKIVPVKASRFNRFVFGFRVIHQSFEVVPIGLIANRENGMKTFSFKGKIITADAADNKKVEQMLTAGFLGKKMPITWQHNAATEHIFTINNIKREPQDGKLTLTWSGKPIGLSEKGKKEIVIPKKGVFKLLKISVEQGKQQQMHFYFSNPLNENQDFKGLIKIDSQTNFEFSVRDNELVVFLQKHLIGLKTVSVFQGIQNIRNEAIKSDTSFQVSFESPKPGIRFVHQGNLLPSTNGMVLPFEAIGLKSVVVRVVKIHQDRIGQFLQVNDLDGHKQLNRVGRPILKKVIQLSNMGVYDPNKWNRFTLELSKLMQPEQGAVYQVALAFTPVDLVHNCGLTSRNDGLTMVSASREKINDASFDNSNGYYFSDEFGHYYNDNYDWSKRDDPCNAAFYSGDNNVIEENILATNIGLLAKRGTDNNLLIIATNLLTAQPLSNVKLHIYNYQLQEIASTSTDNQGKASVNTGQKAFLIEAVHQNQWSYLKINNGSALSVSQFNVSGEKVQQGIKGFLYGDRGVWRPGDSLYLTFMLDDVHHKLPADHPVIFELANPKGTVVQRIVKSSSVKGLYSFKTATPPDAPTGNWTATVKVGGATFVKNIPVETVKPNRLKIDLTFPENKITGNSQTGKLHARWLSGAIAANLKATYDMLLKAIPTKIKGFNDYQFDDPLSTFKSEERTIFEGQLNAAGDATVNPGIHLSKPAPASLKAYLTGKVFEPGGGFSVNYQAVNYYPYQTYIGIKIPKGSGFGDMLDADKNYQIKVASVTADGKPVNLNGLEVSVYKAQWRWWWQSDDHDEADFVNSKYFSKIFNTKINTVNGKGSFPLEVSSTNWGRYYIRVEDKKTGYTSGTFVYFRWPYYSGSNVAGMPGGATRLTFTTDKQSYKIGEKMKLFIPGSGEGNILISVENGSGVLKTYWLREKKGTNAFTIPVTPNMTPNIYLNVSEIQPHNQTVNDLPIRQYGIVAVKVENPETVLHPEIMMPEELKPHGKATIRIKEKNGRPISYTIAIVDEGLLDLTNFKTPQPHDAFYAKEALGVKTWDVFDQVIGAYGGRLERLFSIGGDGAAAQNPETHNLRFKPVVKFFGPYFLKKGETASHSFTMPEYVGEVRAMVVAGYDGAYGSTEKSVPVRQPLMVLATLPRVAGPDEDIMLPVNVFAMKPGVKNVSVHVSSGKHFQVIGAATKTVHFDKPGNTMVMFKIHVAPSVGTGNIKVVASGNGYHAETETHLTVRNPNPPEVRTIAKNLKAGETWSPKIDFFGVKGTNSAHLEVSNILPLNLGRRLSYLTDYPFGCLEQKTSGVFPQLFLSQLVSMPKAQQEQLTKNIKAIIAEIPAYQTASGGFTYWKGRPNPDDWVSSYAGNFLLEAQKQGYQVMQDVLRKWLNYQNQQANDWIPGKYSLSDLAQAYRLYTLALAKHPNWSAMNRMHGLHHLSTQAIWRLAAAYTIAGRKDVAKQLIQKIGTQIPKYHDLYYTYGSKLRDEAMMLQTLTEMGLQERGFQMAKLITKTLNSDEWLSTQETAFSLLALAQFYQHQKKASTVQYSYRENSQAMQSVHSDKIFSRKNLHLKPNASKLSITNKSDGNLYVNVFVKGTPAVGKEISEEHDLKMSVTYKNMKGGIIDPKNLKQGTDIMVEVRITNPGFRGNYQNMALSQIFPSGWEIRNTRFEGIASFFQLSTPTYQDIRDDRVYTFFDLPAGKTKTFRILLNASYAGKFYLPGISCSDMYDHSIIATKPGEWVKVKE